VLIQQGAQLGSYRVLERIGHGGMGEVWLAEHALLKRRAAIKLLRPAFSNNEEMVTRFFNEARAATAISDPGIVQIFDFGHHEDIAYIVMELLEGETLDARRERVGMMPVDDALRFARQVATSLGAAHARQIVHRDLKPENIFLVRDPEVPGGERAKILDFGIAKLTHDEVALKTQTAAVMGTPMWMSPEQCRGAGGVDQRSDIYSLGCVLYLLVTGNPPFEADGFGELFAKHMYEAPRPPTHLNTTLPLDVEAVILRCLAKDPAARYANGAELAAALDAAHKRASQSALVPPTIYTIPPPQQQRQQKFTTLSAAASVIAAPPPRRNMGLVMLGLGGIAVAVAIVTFAVLRPSSESKKPAAPAIAPAAAPIPTPPPSEPAPPPVIEPATTATAQVSEPPAPKAKPVRAKPVKKPATATKPKTEAKKPEPLHGTSLGADGIPTSR
jgi:serine/threonine-protein kinase